MNAPIFSGTFASVCRDLGVSSPDLLLSRRVDLANDREGTMARLDANLVQRLDARFSEPTKRMDSTTRRDALNAWVTSNLSTVLAPMEQAPDNTRYLFVPGRAPRGPLLPIRQTMRLGVQRVEWETYATTGEATWIGTGGSATKKLRKVGEESSYSSQPNGFYGVRYGYNQFDLWQDMLTPGPAIQSTRAATARRVMDEMFERTSGEGNDKRGIPGFLNHGASTTVSVTKSFGAPGITAEELWAQLDVVDQMWHLMNGEQRMVSGVLMPRSHRLKLLSLFKSDGSGVNAWVHAKEKYPWLENIITDQRMEFASQTGGPMWQLWSSDPQLMWREAAAAPMLFGPFVDEMDTDFILLQQDGGVVNRESRLIMRVNMPA
jgi:hypothetical protein